MAPRRRRPVLPVQRDTDPAHAADRHEIEMPPGEILAPERKRARNRMVLRTMVEELLKEWFRH
jgi:hypothetical protein